MTIEQVVSKLRQAGFIVSTRDDFVFVSLRSRQVSTTEIAIALDWDVEAWRIEHSPWGVTMIFVP